MRSAFQTAVSAVNASMVALPACPVTVMQPCERYYSPFKTGIAAMRKKGYTNKQIAQYLWDTFRVGPRANRGNVNALPGQFSLVSATQYVGQFAAFYCK